MGSSYIDHLNNMDGLESEIYSKPIADCIAEEFDATKNYAIGDYVFYNAKLYKFTSTHSAGAWSAAHVTQAQKLSTILSLSSAEGVSF